MIDRCNLVRNKEETEEKIEIAYWAWNSHWWIEHVPGYCKCKWCGAQHTSEMGISVDYPLCKENPVIRRFLNEAEKD